MGTANIVFGWAGSKVIGNPSPSLEPYKSESLTTNSSTSTKSANTAPMGSARDPVARVNLSVTGWVWKGANPTANKTSTGIKVQADTPEYVALSPGDYIAILDDA